MTEKDVRNLLHHKIENAGGLRIFCAEHNLDPGQVSKINNGAKLAPALLAAIGVEEVGSITTYRRIRK